MRSLIKKYIPNAPQVRLYVFPNIPEQKLRNAIRDYAKQVTQEQVLALFDATLMGSGKDGIVFLENKLIYQNTDLDPVQEVKYDDIVRVQSKRRLLGGKEIQLEVNSAYATVAHKLDFSGRPEAAEYVARFLHEAILQVSHNESANSGDSQHVVHTTSSGSNVDAVYAAMEELRNEGNLSEADFDLIVETLMNA